MNIREEAKDSGYNSLSTPSLPECVTSPCSATSQWIECLAPPTENGITISGNKEEDNAWKQVWKLFLKLWVVISCQRTWQRDGVSKLLEELLIQHYVWYHNQHASCPAPRVLFLNTSPDLVGYEEDRHEKHKEKEKVEEGRICMRVVGGEYRWESTLIEPKGSGERADMEWGFMEG